MDYDSIPDMLKLDDGAIHWTSTQCNPLIENGNLRLICIEADTQGILRFWIEEPKWSPNRKTDALKGGK